MATWTKSVYSTMVSEVGWDEENITAPDLARALEGVGVAGIFVHGRTRVQGFSGTVSLAGIDASTTRGADQILRRLRRAARDVCDVRSGVRTFIGV